MPGSHTTLHKDDEIRSNVLTKTNDDDGSTLTLQELIDYGVIVGDTSDGAVALTLPAASSPMAGMVRHFVNSGGNNLTVVVSAGYGAAGSGTDTVTLAQGDAAAVVCDGDNWYAVSHTTPS